MSISSVGQKVGSVTGGDAVEKLGQYGADEMEFDDEGLQSRSPSSALQVHSVEYLLKNKKLNLFFCYREVGSITEEQITKIL